MKNFFLFTSLFSLLSFTLGAQSAPLAIATFPLTETIAPGPPTAPSVPTFLAATFPGGQPELLTQIKAAIVYPELAREYAVEGTVVLRLQLDAQGNIKQHEVIKGLGFGCDAAAVAAVRALPRWEPARRGLQPVSSIVYVPLKFRLR